MSPHSIAILLKDLLFFARTATLVLGAIAIGYGALTLVFGEALWDGPSHVYGTALSVPYAPQSWGLVAMAAGICVISGQLLDRHRLIIVGATVMVLWFLFFGGSFLFDVVESQSPFGAPGALVYLSLCLLMALRSAVKVPGRL
ncbi:hypothetical protein [Rhodococcus sp. B10]|uniref:hypothetical protein n=1 Tax=Rhodococcus sp. B10 TaxID=2695876 RepID=UPI0014312964|nr:hypothetical protein [Rhodococcus sp. B10]NIL77589.1 hypothetical protein [Rhodococcus sp. B10]